MKAFATIIATAALALSTAAQAAPNSGEGYQAIDPNFVSTKTRAEVKAETIAALRRGDILNGEEYPRSVTAPTTPKTRAEVKAELAAAIRNGEIRNEQ
jgi:hypothetical protein